MTENTANVFSELRDRTGMSPERISEIFGGSARTVRRWDKGEVEPKKMVLYHMKSLVYRSNSNFDYTKK